MNKVNLVDKYDNQIGVEDKLKAHKKGKLHRAFSIFVFNLQGEIMLQQRAKGKYHSAGLWSNTVCSHPKPEESLEDATHRRLKEEMRFDCELKEIFSFTYRVELENNLIENEFDHVFLGAYEDDPIPNPDEAMGWKWMKGDAVMADMQETPGMYTEWFKLSLNKVIKYL